MESKILCGADRIDEYRSIFAGKRLGPVTNPSGVQRDFRATADKLAREYTLTAMYSPEHGVRGDRQDGQDIDTYVDEETGVTVYSIYGSFSRSSPSSMVCMSSRVVRLTPLSPGFSASFTSTPARVALSTRTW